MVCGAPSFTNTITQEGYSLPPLWTYYDVVNLILYSTILQHITRIYHIKTYTTPRSKFKAMPRARLHSQNTISLQRNLRKGSLITFYKPNIVQATYTLQFGTNTTQPRLPAATRSNEAHILQNFSPTFVSVFSDGSTKTKDLWLLAKPCHANSKTVFPTVIQQQFQQLQL